MKAFVIMRSDYPRAVVQCNDQDEARNVAASLARKEFEKNKQEWESECNRNYISVKPFRDAFDYYRRRVFWTTHEVPLLNDKGERQ